MTHASAANGIAVAIGWAGLALRFICLAVWIVLFNTEARAAMAMLEHAIVAASTVIFCWNFCDAMRAQSANRTAFGEARAQDEDRLEQLNFQVNHDALTNLPNRRAWMNAMEHAIPKEPLAVIRVDLDRFKKVNDAHGHAAGDAALQHAASCLRSLLGHADVCARLGGDEFGAAPRADTPVTC